MEQHISEVLAKSQSPQLTLLEVLENYNHIELTEDEKTEAFIWAKRRKEKQLEQDAIEREQRAKRMILSKKTDTEIVRGLMHIRMQKIFNDQFVLDEKNKMVFELFCLYFGEDKNFESYAINMGIENPSLDKGIFIYGNFGTGKSWMMKLFCRNQRQCYNISNAKVIAEAYRNSGDEILNDYVEITKAAIDDPSVFYQKQIGLYVDDIGTEDLKNNYGNKKNVIGDLIEMKYFKQTCGIFFHASTNLTAEQLKQYYGERVTSRMREIFNIIELSGGDRRK